MDQVNDITPDISKNDFIKNKDDHTIVGVTEILNCKNAFTKLDEYNHEFIDVVHDGNGLFYIFAAILNANSIQNIPKTGKLVTKHIREILQSFWNELTKAKKNCTLTRNH